MPISPRVSLTSSNLNGLMMASIFFMSYCILFGLSGDGLRTKRRKAYSQFSKNGCCESRPVLLALGCIYTASDEIKATAEHASGYARLMPAAAFVLIFF